MITDKLHAKLDTQKFTGFTRAITSVYEPILLCNFGRTGAISENLDFSLFCITI